MGLLQSKALGNSSAPFWKTIDKNLCDRFVGKLANVALELSNNMGTLMIQRSVNKIVNTL